VDGPIGGLGAEDGGDQQLVGSLEVELAAGVVDLLQPGDGLLRPLSRTVGPQGEPSRRLAVAAMSAPAARPARRRFASFITIPKPEGPEGFSSSMIARSSVSSS